MTPREADKVVGNIIAPRDTRVQEASQCPPQPGDNINEAKAQYAELKQQKKPMLGRKLLFGLSSGN